MRKRLAAWVRPKRNSSSAVGWVLIGLAVVRAIMDAFDVVRVAKYIWHSLPIVADALTSWQGTLTAVVIGLGLIYYGNILYEKRDKSRHRKKDYDYRVQQLAHALTTMANNDTPERCLVVRSTRIDLQSLKNLQGPYLTFHFSVFNASVCEVEFKEPIVGHIKYKGNELKDSLEFPPGSLRPRMPRLGQSSIELRQFDLPDVANEILETVKDKNKQRIGFDFTLVKLPLVLQWPECVVGKTWELRLPRTLSFQGPLDGNIVFPIDGG